MFHHAVGGSEEILGEITREIRDIAESFTLTPEQRAERLQQLGDNKIRQVHEETALEERQAELFGLTVPNRSWREEIAEAESFWLAPEALQRCVSSYLSGITDSRGGFLQGGKPLKTLRLGRTVRSALLDDFRRLPRSTDPVARQWEKWLRGAEPLLTVTFDQETAADDPKAVHLDVLHPLVRQAARHLEHSEAVQVNLTVVSDSFPPGAHRFALHQWRKAGAQPDDSLVAVASDPRLEACILSLLEEAADASGEVSPDPAATERLEERHHALWRASRANHVAENRKLVDHRVQSLTISHRARTKVLEDQIERATDEKIRRMKEGELARADRDCERRIGDLKRLTDSADIHATLVVHGMLTVRRDDAA